MDNWNLEFENKKLLQLRGYMYLLVAYFENNNEFTKRQKNDIKKIIKEIRIIDSPRKVRKNERCKPVNHLEVQGQRMENAIFGSQPPPNIDSPSVRIEILTKDGIKIIPPNAPESEE